LFPQKVELLPTLKFSVLWSVAWKFTPVPNYPRE